MGKCGGRMIDKYVIERNEDSVQVFAVHRTLGPQLIAYVSKDVKLADIAERFFEVLASIGGIRVEIVPSGEAIVEG